MKLMFIVNSLDFFISHRLDIAIAAQKQKYEVHIFTFSSGDESKILGKGFQYHPIKLRRSKLNLFNDLLIFIKLFKILYLVKPNIVHLVTLKPIIYGGIVSKLLSINSIVIAFSGLGTIFTKSKKNYFFYRLLIIQILKIIFSKKNKLKVIFQNKDDQKLIEKYTNLKRSKSIIIRGSGVDLNHFKNLKYKNSIFIISMISRFLFNKGINEYIQSVKILKKKYPHIIFRIVGSIDIGNPESISVSELDKLKKDPNIEIIENSNNVLKIINESKIIVLPSYREGLPKVLLEAAACERVVVTTNVPGCKDVVIDNITGKIAKPRNIYDLSNKIDFLINKQDKLFSMGIMARKHVQLNFSLKYVVKSHLNLYEEMLG